MATGIGYRPGGGVSQCRREVSEVQLRLRNEYSEIQIFNPMLAKARERKVKRSALKILGENA